MAAVSLNIFVEFSLHMANLIDLIERIGSWKICKLVVTRWPTYLVMVPFIVADSVLLILALFKWIQSVHELGYGILGTRGIMQVLVQDSVLYFLV